MTSRGDNRFYREPQTADQELRYDEDGLHIYWFDPVEGCWVAFRRVDCVGEEELPEQRLPRFAKAHTPTDDYPDAEGLAALRAQSTPTDDVREPSIEEVGAAFQEHEGAPTWQDDPVARDAALRWHMRGFKDGLNARRTVQGEPTDDARAIIRQVREFATKERDSIRGRYGAGSATYAGYANACDDILSILDGDPSAHDRDRDGICRRCGHGLTAAELLDGETPCQPQGDPTDTQEAYFETLRKINPSPSMARIIERAKRDLERRAATNRENGSRSDG